jgi:hypothetical protein
MNADDFVGWQPNPDRRGTLGIIWGCFFTILACTWTIQHPNLPAKYDLWIEDFGRKFLWTIVNVVIPEFPLAHAISERRWAYNCLEKLEDRDIEVKKRTWHDCWTAFYKWPSSHIDPKEEPEKWTIHHCYYGNMGGFTMDLGTNQTVLTMEKYLKRGEERRRELFRVHPEDPLSSPPLRRTQIEDRDKGDAFVKMVALAQILWLWISLFARLAEHIACSQLEILTSAFAGCAFLTYVIRWDKPKNIRVGTEIEVLGTQNLYSLGRLRTFRESIAPRLSKLLSRHVKRHSDLESARIPEDAIGESQDSIQIFLQLMVFMFMIGGIHLFAWDFHFPTLAERMLWRIACSVATGLPATLFIVVWLLPIVIHFPKEQLSEEPTNINLGFMQHCLDAMKILKDELPNRFPTAPYRNLQQIVDTVDPRQIIHLPDEDYRKIFGRALLSTKDSKGAKEKAETKSEIESEHLEAYLDALKDVVNNPERDSDQQFRQDFHQLRKLLLKQARRDSNPLRKFLLKLPGINDKTIQTNNFPRTWKRGVDERRRKWIEFFAVPAGIIYLLARLCIFAVAFSTLRVMPDSVYETTWAKYFPYLD